MHGQVSNTCSLHNDRCPRRHSRNGGAVGGWSEVREGRFQKQEKLWVLVWKQGRALWSVQPRTVLRGWGGRWDRGLSQQWDKDGLQAIFSHETACYKQLSKSVPS